MAEIEIRPTLASEISTIRKMDHSCTSDYVWQMDTIQGEGQAGAVFREIRLPRTIKLSYPHSLERVTDEWTQKTGLLVGLEKKSIVGYVRLSEKIIPKTAWILDLVVDIQMRRKGVGAALLLAAQEWAKDRSNRQMILECTSKNAACIRLARKMGYEFSGYNDHYYLTQEIAVFFSRHI